MAEVKIQIRKAKIEDLEIIRKLNQELFRYEYENFDKTLDCKWSLGEEHKKSYEKNIIDPAHLTLVVFVNEKIVGYLVGSIIEAECYRKLKKIIELDNMFISEKYRKLGIGKKLVQELIKWSKSEGIERIKVIASAKNIRAINFYKKNGLEDYSIVLEGDI